ncbi:MAG: DUF2975 domain-containing protein [Lachnospiraceae bacterium]|nr:DUF2975 domain-containing protein [Lachnospiraceae bacterium]MBQ9122035.1 DUF2975 domain-containing protein [Lachnospiraceae bacterium]
MEKIKNIASFLDRLLKVAYWLLIVCSIIVFVAFGVFTFVPGLADEPTGSWSLSIGNVDLLLADGVAQMGNGMLVENITTMIYLAVIVVFSCYGIRVLRRIMTPMIAGKPFDGTVSGDVKKLSYTLIAGSIAYGVVGSVANALTYAAFDLNNLLLSEKIVGVTVDFELVDVKTLLLGIIIYMLSYVFAYGEKLQQQDDETL